MMKRERVQKDSLLQNGVICLQPVAIVVRVCFRVGPVEKGLGARGSRPGGPGCKGAVGAGVV